MRRKRRREFDWQRACAEAARRHSRRGDRIIVGIICAIGIAFLIYYWVFLTPV